MPLRSFSVSYSFLLRCSCLLALLVEQFRDVDVVHDVEEQQLEAVQEVLALREVEDELDVLAPRQHAVHQHEQQETVLQHEVDDTLALLDELSPQLLSATAYLLQELLSFFVQLFLVALVFHFVPSLVPIVVLINLAPPA